MTSALFTKTAGEDFIRKMGRKRERKCEVEETIRK
jgi:hypothetical protein